MKWLDFVKAFLKIPDARKHLTKIMQQLKSHNYQQLINDTVKPTTKINSINTIVKSYFWASRTIKNCHCLPRSIALYQKLKASGYPVEHKFGVNKKHQSLAAHAWVEYQNQPLNESKHLNQRFEVMNHPD
jgi:hypothetical protein